MRQDCCACPSPLLLFFVGLMLIHTPDAASEAVAQLSFPRRRDESIHVETETGQKKQRRREEFGDVMFVVSPFC